MAKNCVWLLTITPRILVINELQTTTFNFDSKLTVDKAKMLNSYSGQKAYRFWLIKRNSAGIFPCMNQNLPKLLLTQLQSRGQQPFSPDPSILSKGPAASCPFSCWSGPRQPSTRDGGLILRFLTWTSPAPWQRKEGSISAQGSWNPSLPVAQPAALAQHTCATRGTLFPPQAGTREGKHRTKKSTAHQASSHLTVFLLLPSFLIFQE